MHEKAVDDLLWSAQAPEAVQGAMVVALFKALVFKAKRAFGASRLNAGSGTQNRHKNRQGYPLTTQSLVRTLLLCVANLNKPLANF